MIYFWEIPDDYPEHLIGEYIREESPDRFDFKKGIPLKLSGTPTFRFEASVEELSQIDDLANNAMVPLVSERIATVLKKTAGEGVQLFEADISCRNGSLEGYSVLNICNLLEVVDMQKSAFTCVPGTNHPMSFSKVVLAQNNLGELQLVRDENYTSFLLISEELADFLRVLTKGEIGVYAAEDLSL